MNTSHHLSLFINHNIFFNHVNNTYSIQYKKTILNKTKNNLLWIELEALSFNNINKLCLLTILENISNFAAIFGVRKAFLFPTPNKIEKSNN